MKSNKHLEKYWLNIASKLTWHKFPKLAFKEINNRYEWFKDGRIDIYYNLIGKYLIKSKKNKKIIFIYDLENKVTSFSFEEIDTLVDNFLTNLINLKVKKMKILLHTKASINSVISMLACLKIGIEFSVIFEELKSEAIKKRVNLFNPDIVISDNFQLKNLRKKTDNDFSFVSFKKIMKINSKIKSFKSLHFNSSKQIFTLFTSGSTGLPKGIVHSLGGYMVYSYFTSHKVFGLNKNSFILTASDAGWINGHTYALFGPLLCNSKTLIMEKPFMLLNENTINRILDLGITILYLPVTLIRILKSLDIKIKNSKFLKNLGSMGEPLSNDVGYWFSKKFYLPKKNIINTYYQTENGGVISSFLHNSKFVANIHDSVGKSVSKYIKFNKLNNNNNEIKILTPWPGMMTKVLGKKEIYKSYFDNQTNYQMFDYATKVNNNIFIHGRSDDVINIRGHRIGSEELESVLLKNKNIVECSAISINDELEGSSFSLFVCKKKNKKISTSVLDRLIINNFGSFAIPKSIYFVKELPKTRSGKIMRRVLRLIVNRDFSKLNNQDTSTMINSKIISEIKKVVINGN